MSYIGNEPVVSATRTLTEYTATAGQTTFTAIGGYTVGFIDVIINGAQLNSDDFTATNGSTVVLTNACSVGDNVRLVAYGTFSVANIPSGALTSGAPTWSPTGGVSLPRIDSSTEGGQLNLNRSSDNANAWAVDVYGSGTTPSLRIIDTVLGTVRAAFDSSGNFQFNSGYGSVATAYGCRAWVNFNGTGTVAIRASGNVSSITDNGVGDYTVNFTTAMPDANYSCVGTCGETASGGNSVLQTYTAVSGNIRVTSRASSSNSFQDSVNVFVSIFR